MGESEPACRYAGAGVDKKQLGPPSPSSPEAAKKLLQVGRAGRDIEKAVAGTGIGR